MGRGSSTTAPTNFGRYEAVASFAGSTDYNIAGSSVNFDITQNPTLTVTDLGGVYDAAPYTATAIISPSDSNSGSSLEGVTPVIDYFQLVNGGSTSLGTTAPVNAGSYEALATYAGSQDWSATSNIVKFNITPATPSFSDLSLSQSVVTYGAGNTGDIYASGLLTVTGSNPLVTPGTETGTNEANALIVIYNGSHSINGVQSFLNSDGTFSNSINVGALPVGSYTIVFSYLGDATTSGNFNAATSESMNLTVDAAPLTITANNVSSIYGDGTTLNNATGFTANGLVNGETIGSVTLATNATLSNTGNWNAGSWAITPSNAVTSGVINPEFETTFAASNYDITYNTGMLNVAQVTPVLTVTDAGGIYNATPYTATATINGGSSLEGVTPTIEYAQFNQ